MLWYIHCFRLELCSSDFGIGTKRRTATKQIRKKTRDGVMKQRAVGASVMVCMAAKKKLGELWLEKRYVYRAFCVRFGCQNLPD